MRWWRAKKLPAEIRYQDFFTFHPERKFGPISMMGVIEDLLRLPGGDAPPGGMGVPRAGGSTWTLAAERDRFGNHSFVTETSGRGPSGGPPSRDDGGGARVRPSTSTRRERPRNYHLWCRNCTAAGWEAGGDRGLSTAKAVAHLLPAFAGSPR